VPNRRYHDNLVMASWEDVERPENWLRAMRLLSCTLAKIKRFKRRGDLQAAIHVSFVEPTMMSNYFELPPAFVALLSAVSCEITMNVAGDLPD